MNASLLSTGTAALALAAAIPSAGAQALLPDATAGAPPTPVVAIVRVPKPWYAPRAVVVGRMRDTTAQYARLPGLLFKAFSFERDSGDFGGLYLWADAARAQAWFDAAWFERVRRERGVEAQVRFFEALVSVDNTAGGPSADDGGRAVGTLVEVPIPPGVTRERLAAGFKAAVPTYRQVPGLLRKHFTVSPTGHFGGVYLWRDEASARAWFNAAWQDRVVGTYGHAARIEWFDTPILLPSQDDANLAAARTLPGLSP